MRRGLLGFFVALSVTLTIREPSELVMRREEEASAGPRWEPDCVEPPAVVQLFPHP